MADKLEIILQQLPTKITTGQIVFVVACADTPDIRWIEEHVEKLNEQEEWVRLKVAKSVRENEVPVNTAVIVCLINVIESTILQMKKRARNTNNPCRCLSASLTKNQLKIVLERADKIREKAVVGAPVSRSAPVPNGNGNHSSRPPFSVDVPQVSLAIPANGRPIEVAVTPVAAATPERESEIDATVDAEGILKTLDELPAAAASFVKMVGKAQEAVILLSTKVETLELQNEELAKENAEFVLRHGQLSEGRSALELQNEELRKENAALEEKNRIFQGRIDSMEATVAEFEKLKSTLAPLLRGGV